MKVRDNELCLERRTFVATTTKTKVYINFGQHIESVKINHLAMKHNDSAQKLSCEFGIELNNQDYPIEDIVEITTLQVASVIVNFPVTAKGRLYAKVWTDASSVSGIITVIGELAERREITLPTKAQGKP